MYTSTKIEALGLPEARGACSQHIHHHHSSFSFRQLAASLGHTVHGVRWITASLSAQYVQVRQTAKELAIKGAHMLMGLQRPWESQVRPQLRVLEGDQGI